MPRRSTVMPNRKRGLLEQAGPSSLPVPAKKTKRIFNPNPPLAPLTLRTRNLQPLLTCAHCGVGHRGKPSLTAHITSTHFPSPHRYQCGSCPFTALVMRDMRTHWTETHEGEFACSTLLCELCNTYSESTSHLEAHVKRQHAPYVTCQECDHVAMSPTLLLTHYESTHGDPARITYVVSRCRQITRELFTVEGPTSSLKCTFCSKVFSISCNLFLHIVIFHLKFPYYQCPYCPHTTHSEHVIKRHIKNQHKLCSGSFVITEVMTKMSQEFKEYTENLAEHTKFGHFLAYTLGEHVRKEHATEKHVTEEIFTECDSNFAAPPMLEHFHQHHLSAMTCTICKKVVMREALHDPEVFKNCIDQWEIGKKTTKLVHQKVKNFNSQLECYYCKKCFTSKKLLTRHMRQMHINGKRYQCGKCPYMDRLKSSMENHWRTMHVGPYKIIKNELCCDVCYKIFSTEVHLHNHITLKHKSTLQCTACKHEPIFTTISEIQDHIVSNHGRAVLDVYMQSQYAEAYKRFSHSTKKRCYMCFKKCSKRYLLLHIVTKHLRLLPFQCKLCSFQSLAENPLKSHYLKEHPKCRYLFFLNRHLIWRSKIKKNEVRKKNTKSGQNKFENKKSAHQLKVIVTSQNQKCIEMKSKEQILKKEPKNRKLKCMDCGLIFEDNKQLQNHTAQMSNLKFYCHICPRTGKSTAYTKLSNFENHILKLHGLDVLKNHRPVLNQEINDKVAHLRKNPITQVFRCFICSKSFFKEKETLMKHVKSVHFNFKHNAEFQCCYCFFTCTSIAHLQNHIEENHDMFKSAENDGEKTKMSKPTTVIKQGNFGESSIKIEHGEHSSMSNFEFVDCMPALQDVEMEENPLDLPNMSSSAYEENNASFEPLNFVFNLGYVAPKSEKTRENVGTDLKTPAKNTVGVRGATNSNIGSSRSVVSSLGDATVKQEVLQDCITIKEEEIYLDELNA